MLKQMKTVAILGFLSFSVVACGGGGGGGGGYVTEIPNDVVETPIERPDETRTLSSGTVISNTPVNAADTRTGQTIVAGAVEAAGVALINAETGAALSAGQVEEIYNSAEFQTAAADAGLAIPATWDGFINSVTNSGYDIVNVTGLQTVHAQGWTGKDVNIGIYDEGGHGVQVATTASWVAPGATVSYFGTQTPSAITGQDVTNHSYGRGVGQAAWAVSHFNAVDANNPNALHVLAAANVGRPGTQYNSANGYADFNGQASELNDAATVAYLAGDLNGTYIFVGAVDKAGNLNSAGAGAVADDFIVADGYDPLLDQYGTSFAAPKVSGAAALVIHKFGTNKADTKEILLLTANDDGIYSNSAMYGHGLLDVGAALSPVGNIN